MGEGVGVLIVRSITESRYVAFTADVAANMPDRIPPHIAQSHAVPENRPSSAHALTFPNTARR